MKLAINGVEGRHASSLFLFIIYLFRFVSRWYWYNLYFYFAGYYMYLRYWCSRRWNKPLQVSSATTPMMLILLFYKPFRLRVLFHKTFPLRHTFFLICTTFLKLYLIIRRCAWFMPCLYTAIWLTAFWISSQIIMRMPWLRNFAYEDDGRLILFPLNNSKDDVTLQKTPIYNLMPKKIIELIFTMPQKRCESIRAIAWFTYKPKCR